MRKKLRTYNIILFLTILCIMSNCSPKAEEPAPAPDAPAIASNNRGVALMGQFKYEEARKVFHQLAGQYPHNLDFKVNLAIAVLNRQEEKDDQKALSILKQVLEKDPENLRAGYCIGLLEMHMGRPDVALGNFQRVIESHPEDEEALYFAGKCLMQLSRYENALDYFQRSISADPHLSSAYYGAIMALRNLDKSVEAMAMMEEFKRLKENPRARVIEFKYTRMGRKAEVLAVDSGVEKPTPKPRGHLFATPIALTDNLEPLIAGEKPVQSMGGPTITVCDVNGDGHTDIFITRVKAASTGGFNLLLLAGPNGEKPAPAMGHPLSRVEAVNAALWGDINNDGLVDVYFCREGENQLWIQEPKGEWRNSTEETHTAAGNFHTVDGAIFDADHDGDLDLFLVNANGPNELLNNNRDGTFRPIAKDHGLTGNGLPSRSVLITDLDRDRDADIIVINSQPPHDVYFNGRLWEYNQAEGFREFRESEIVAAVSADMDTDGFPEIYTVDSSNVLSQWKLGENKTWKRLQLKDGGESHEDGKSGAPGLAIVDVDGDGELDLLHSVGRGIQLFSSGKTIIDKDSPEEPGLAAWTVMASKRGPSLLGWTPGRPLSLWNPGPGRYPFISMTLSGRKDPESNWRSNASGIGARLSVRVGSRWTVLETFRNNSGPGQSLQPYMVGLRGAPKADFVAIDWSDGVFQTELDTEPDTIHHIVETQRQLSSCPVLFAWNGKKFEFVSDLLGVGGIGFALAPGEYAEPRPNENFMLPPGLLQPKNGRLMIKLTEPMEEITYLDAVRLVSYDLPPNWFMALDERMGILGPTPTGKPFFYRKVIVPQKVINERGDDVTDYVLRRDLLAAPAGPLDRRFIGRLENDHILTLNFPETLDQSQGRAFLLADGWVEYPYSQTNFAAWQAGADYRAPTLEVLRPDGQWDKILDQFGYPAGMPRQMAVPFPQLPQGIRTIRMGTNQEVYWDKLAVVFAEECPEVKGRELKLVSAKMEKTGFSKRTDGPQRLPGYDFHESRPVWDTRFPEGNYTRFGPVHELVKNNDDAVVIFGPGEGVHLEFEETKAELKPGWSRVYVIEAFGWCKDMDLYTKDGGRVAPLPSSGKPPKHAENLHRIYNTRYEVGRQ